MPPLRANWELMQITMIRLLRGPPDGSTHFGMISLEKSPRTRVSAIPVEVVWGAGTLSAMSWLNIC